MKNMDKEKLINTAKRAAEFSYSPYSNFRVGAALLCHDGSITTGTNIENRSYGLTNCAERSAVFTAVSSGKKDFTGIAIYSPDSDKPLPPCGACRQVLSEFGGPEFIVLFSGKNNNTEEVLLKDLLPYDSLHQLKNR